jgi:hypothetical protein
MKLIYCTALIAVMSIALSCDNTYKEDAKPKLTISGVISEDKESETAPKEDHLVTAGDQTADSTTQQKPQIPGNNKQAQAEPKQNIDWDKKIIKNATINAEVKDFKSYYTSFREKVKSFGGYIAQEEQNQSDYKIENSVVIKVPVDQFDDAVLQITANTEKINEKKITSADVTTEVVDTKSRMETKRQVRSRYLDLLKQAKNMDEILHVQNDINGIQEEIESAAGRIEFLNHASVFSTINMTFYQVLDVSAKDNGKPSLGTELTNAFLGGSGWIRDLFVGIVSIWPLVFIVGAVVIMYRKTRIRKGKPEMKEQGSGAVI